MKTKQELLDFYGVEIGKKYKITNADNKNRINQTFTIQHITTHLTVLLHGFLYGKPYDYVALLSSLDDWTYEEVKPPILDDKEREYLQKYIMDNPAFKGKVEAIVKISRGEEFKEFLGIRLTFSRKAFLPEFKQNSMYKGMEIGRDYTPQELGLKE